jgi:hypothetical protein
MKNCYKVATIILFCLGLSPIAQAEKETTYDKFNSAEACYEFLALIYKNAQNGARNMALPTGPVVENVCRKYSDDPSQDFGYVFAWESEVKFTCANNKNGSYYLVPYEVVTYFNRADEFYSLRYGCFWTPYVRRIQIEKLMTCFDSNNEPIVDAWYIEAQLGFNLIQRDVKDSTGQVVGFTSETHNGFSSGREYPTPCRRVYNAKYWTAKDIPFMYTNLIYGPRPAKTQF